MLKLKINELLDKESMMWFQRASALYLQLGDNNTQYFHNRASQRYKRNRIHGLRDSQNAWCTSEPQIKEIATSFYKGLFSSSCPKANHPIYGSIQSVVSEDINRALL